MSFRMIEMVMLKEYRKDVLACLDDQSIIDTWSESLADNRVRIKILVPGEAVETVLDLLEKKFDHVEGFRLVLFSVEAVLPAPPIEKTPGKTDQKPESPKARNRLSRAELLTDVEQMARSSWVFGLLIVLSSAVASFGILRNNVVVIIGAMVIAPVLGPNVALALGTALGDTTLSRKAVKTLAVGIGVALAFSALFGVLLRVDPGAPELVLRTKVHAVDVALALAAGSAGVLSLVSGTVSALIGVMVAVALLPPLVAAGLLIGSGHWASAWGAVLLFLTNLICINLSGVVTFLAQGVFPRNFWEAQKARRAVRRAVLIWTLLLVGLVVVIWLAQGTRI